MTDELRDCNHPCAECGNDTEDRGEGVRVCTYCGDWVSVDYPDGPVKRAHDRGDER